MNRVREIRKLCNLTQEELADMVATSQQQIQRIETGQPVTLEMACRISGALKMPLAEMFPEESAHAYQPLTNGHQRGAT